MYSLKGDIMECKVYKLNELKEYKYVVILSKYQEKILLSRHKKRSTWETQGGHIEKGETPLEAAKRELFEESGAVKFSILPVFDYWAGDDKFWANGMVFMAEITELSDIPDSEMKEVRTFFNLPDSLTYPEITPVLFNNAKKFF
ncbi:NUDIX domain-containing protein [Clostridium estertheticum]|nr:NUDIX domain-containing protein [Clostridium estertheticum]WBL48512.1 NUDIX domain-containing protein [Clostridium estertheticum]